MFNIGSGQSVYLHDQVFDGSPVFTGYSGYDSVIIERCTYRNLHSNIYGTALNFVDVDYVRIEDCVFENITRSVYGDRHAINVQHNIDTVIIRNCDFYDIAADGIQVGQTIWEDRANRYINYVLIDSCNFINDPTKSSENGIDWKGGCTDKAIISNCYFSGFYGCDASQGCTGDNGAGLVIHYKLSQNITVTGCTFENNYNGSFNGSGAGNGDPRAPENITFEGNKFINSTHMGFGMWECVNLTFQNNIIDGAELGLTVDSIYNIDLRNNTIVNCTDRGMWEYEASSGTMDYSNNLMVACGTTNSMDMGSGQNNLHFSNIDDLHFVDPANYNYHLTEASTLAIGQGYLNGLTYDMDGHDRLGDGLMDVGADEYSPDNGAAVNMVPVANAGIDQNDTDTDNNGSEQISLNANGSYDSDGTIVSYSWSLNGTEIVTGLNPTVSLSVGVHNITLMVTDNEGATDTDIIQIVVNAGSEPNQTPNIEAQGFEVDEDDFSTNLGYITATDPDDDDLNFSIESGNSEGVFSLNATTGQLSLTTSDLDFTDNPTYNLQVRVSDNGSPNLTDQATISISFFAADVNQAPNIEAQGFEVDESDFSTNLGYITATDPDDDDLSFSIESGNSEGVFTLNATTGQLSLTTSDLDFTDNPVFNLQVSVTDNGSPNLTGQAEISVSLIATIVNNAPDINAQSFNVVESDILETYIGTVLAYDVDLGQTVNYSIASGNEDGMFEIDEATGELSFVSFPDDFYSVSLFTLEIEVADDASSPLSDMATISIHLIPSNSVYYIDPNVSDDDEQDGTVENPYKSWQTVDWENNALYLQKRGTIAYENEITIDASGVLLGGYGIGNNPAIVSYSGMSAITSNNRSDIVVDGLDITAEKAIASLYFIGEGSDNITVKNCSFMNSDNGIRIIDGGHFNITKNTFENTGNAIYILAVYADINYNNFSSNLKGINFSLSNADARIYNNVFYNNQHGIYAELANTIIYNNIFDLSSSASCAIEHTKENCISDYNIFYPEKEGFVIIDGSAYNTISELKTALDLEENSLVKDPLFKSVMNKSFEVEDNSPAIDAGIYIGPLEDMYGTLVPVGAAPDIGSFEALNPLSDETVYDKNVTEEVDVYPNPTEGDITVLNKLNIDIKNVEVLDFSGRLQYAIHYDDFEIGARRSIDLTGFPKGLYVLRLVTSDEEVINRKVVVK